MISKPPTVNRSLSAEDDFPTREDRGRPREDHFPPREDDFPVNLTHSGVENGYPGVYKG